MRRLPFLRWNSTLAPSHGTKLPPFHKSTTFAQIGVRPALCEALKQQGLLHPTSLQSRLIPFYLSWFSQQQENSYQTLLIRDRTGSGKTLGLLLALLNLPSLPSAAASQHKWSCEHLMVVPHGDLIEQLWTWVRQWLPESHFPDLSRIVQTTYQGAPPSRAPHGPTKLLLTTPTKLLEHLTAHDLHPSLASITLDEVDAMTPPVSKYDKQAQSIRRRHPKELESCIAQLQAGTTSLPKLICSSATLSNRVKRHLETLGWVQHTRACVLDVNRNELSPHTTHRSVCIDVPQTSDSSVFLLANVETMLQVQQDQRAQLRSLDTFRQKFLGPVESKGLPPLTQGAPSGSSEPQHLAAYLGPMLDFVVAYCRHFDVPSALVVTLDAQSPTRICAQLSSHAGVHARLFVAASPPPDPTECDVRHRLTLLSVHALRGLDLLDFTHIFLLGVPRDAADYIHIVGRVGRLGAPHGTAVTLVPTPLASKFHSVLTHSKASHQSFDFNVLQKLQADMVAMRSPVERVTNNQACLERNDSSF